MGFFAIEHTILFGDGNIVIVFHYQINPVIIAKYCEMLGRKDFEAKNPEARIRVLCLPVLFNIELV